MKLYDYFRSSAAYRVRIALNLKGIEAERIPVNLVEGSQHADDYLRINPERLVPALATDNGTLSQSLAIIEYLDELYPTPALLPTDAWQRAQQRALAYAIACDIHPINNLRVQHYLKRTMHQDDAAVREWMVHWMSTGFKALEVRAPDEGFFGGTSPMLADVALVPQMYNAHRFEVPMAAFPKLVAINTRCRALEPFAKAAPEAAG